MLVSEDLADAGTIPIWMADAATGAIVTSWPELLLRAMSESVPSVAAVCVDTHGLCYHRGHRIHAC